MRRPSVRAAALSGVDHSDNGSSTAGDGVRRRSQRRRLLAGLTAATLTLTACAGEDPRSEDDSADGEVLEPVPDARADELVVLHPFTAADDVAGLEAVLGAFTDLHPDVVVRAEQVTDIPAAVRARVDAGTPPDVVFSSQPHLLQDFVMEGAVTPLDGVVDVTRLEEELVGGLLDVVTFDGLVAAVPVRLRVKSLVWFNPTVFAANGYAIPGTWDEMLALSDRMVADGLAPWCIGIESGEATGWVATDWVEDILLRTIGVDAYERWVAGDLAFASREVQGALEDYLVPIWTNDAYVAGGSARIAREDYGDAFAGILGDAPTCGLHRQAAVIERFLPDVAPEATFGVDYDFFIMPGITPGERPVLGEADVAASFTDGEAAARLLQFLATPASGEGWAAFEGFVSPFAPVFDRSLAQSPSSARLSELLADTTAFRLDGSDRMPAEVGASARPGSFWSEMTRWIRGETSLSAALTAIDARYAASR